jgi:hypothetical protein
MIHFFQPQFVFHTQTQNHSKNKQHILNHLNFECSSKSDMGNAITTNGKNDLSCYTPEILNDIIWNPFDQMIQELQCFSPAESRLHSIWWNYYQAGEYTEPHKHVDADFSGIYLLHLEEPNTTVFYQNGDSSSIPLFDEYYHTQHMTEGTTIIFPSRLLHYANPSLKERYVVVFNITTIENVN